MNVITKAISDLLFKIPRPILEKVFIQFKTGGNWRNPVETNLEESILAAVVRPRVLVDCNLAGGEEVIIPLSKATKLQWEDYSIIIRVPKEITDGRSILSVRNITFGSFLSYQAMPINQSTMMQASKAMIDAFSRVPSTTSGAVKLIGENTILFKERISSITDMYLRCIVTHDEYLSNIQPKSYIHFSKLVEHAVKSYIYNEYIVRLDMGELVGGQQLGIFKEIISDYREHEELYQEYLKDYWSKVVFMNDHESMNRYIKMMVGGNR